MASTPCCCNGPGQSVPANKHDVGSRHAHHYLAAQRASSLVPACKLKALTVSGTALAIAPTYTGQGLPVFVQYPELLHHHIQHSLVLPSTPLHALRRCWLWMLLWSASQCHHCTNLEPIKEGGCTIPALQAHDMGSRTPTHSLPWITVQHRQAAASDVGRITHRPGSADLAASCTSTRRHLLYYKPQCHSCTLPPHLLRPGPPYPPAASQSSCP